MSIRDFGKGEEKGKLLGTGWGWADMLDACKARGWSEENTILVVMDSSRPDSQWKIYEKKGQYEY